MEGEKRWPSVKYKVQPRAKQRLGYASWERQPWVGEFVARDEVGDGGAARRLRPPRCPDSDCCTSCSGDTTLRDTGRSGRGKAFSAVLFQVDYHEVNRDGDGIVYLGKMLKHKRAHVRRRRRNVTSAVVPSCSHH